MDEIFHPFTNVIADFSEDVQPMFITSNVGWRRVFEAVMKALSFAGKDRANFIRVFADGDDEIEFLSDKFVYVFRAMAGNINADFVHCLNRFGADEAGFGSSTEDFKIFPAIVTQNSFRHLAASGISSAEN